MEAGDAASGFAAATLNGQRLTPAANSSRQDAAERGGRVVVDYLSAFSVRVLVGNFDVWLDNSDGFVNLQRVHVLDWSRLSREDTHGLLGQTWHEPGRSRWPTLKATWTTTSRVTHSSATRCTVVLTQARW